MHQKCCLQGLPPDILCFYPIKLQIICSSSKQIQQSHFNLKRQKQSIHNSLTIIIYITIRIKWHTFCLSHLLNQYPNQYLNNNMPKHQGPIQKLIDPFSIPAQMNNLGVLIVAYVTKDMYEHSTCNSQVDIKFLNFIYYGSTIVCGGTFLMSLLYMIGLLDYCINKVMPCGEVCLTLNTLTIFLAGILYHCMATVYGLTEMFWGQSSPCVQIEMFKRITGIIYLIWFVCLLGYLLFNVLYYNRTKKLQTVEEQYIEM